MYQEVLEIERKALGPDHPSVATTLHNIAIVKRRKGEYDRANSPV